ncbi:MAG: hypothetical protein V4693_17080 [Pseudomonadota bacterium]
MHPVSTSCALLLAAALAAPAAARTADPASAERAPPAQPTPAPPQHQRLGVAAADELLDGTRGGNGTTDIDMRLTGSVSGNSATNVSSGANVITNGAFANMAGIPLVVQNTGANVLIQSATVINLRMN